MPPLRPSKSTRSPLPANWPRTSWRGLPPTIAQGRRHPCGADRPVVDRLGLQHSRQRRAAYAAGARLRHSRGGWTASALHRQAQAADEDRSLSHPALPTCARPRALKPTIAELAKAGAKVALDPVLAAERLQMLVDDNGGTVVAAADPARIPRATKNARRNRRRPRGAPARWRGGHEAALLARRAAAGDRSTRSPS